MISEKKPDERLGNAVSGEKFGSTEGILISGTPNAVLSRCHGRAAHPQTEPSALRAKGLFGGKQKHGSPRPDQKGADRRGPQALLRTRKTSGEGREETSPSGDRTEPRGRSCRNGSRANVPHLEDRLRRRSARPAVTTVPSLHPRAGKGQRQRGKEKRRGRRSTPGTRAEVLPRAKRSKKAFPGAGKTKDAPQRADGAPAAGAEGRRGNRVEKERDEQREGRQAFGKRSPVRSDGPQEGIVSEKRFFRWQNGRPQGRKTLPRNPVTALTDKRSAANGFLHRQRATCAGKRLRPQNKRPMPDDATSPLNERHAGNIPRAPCKEILRKEKRCPRRQGTRPARQKRRQAPATA